MNKHNKGVETRYVSKTIQTTARSKRIVMDDYTTVPFGRNGCGDGDHGDELTTDEDYAPRRSGYKGHYDDGVPELDESDDGDVSTAPPLYELNALEQSVVIWCCLFSGACLR